jgi:hypothetical protein
VPRYLGQRIASRAVPTDAAKPASPDAAKPEGNDAPDGQ